MIRTTVKDPTKTREPVTIEFTWAEFHLIIEIRYFAGIKGVECN